MTFVRAKDRKKFRLLVASARAMTFLLREVLRVDRAASLHAGCYNWFQRETLHYAEILATDFLDQFAIDNTILQFERLLPIRKRLRRGLALEDQDILPIPMYFRGVQIRSDDPNNQQVVTKLLAESIGMVNMLVVNDSLMVPRPFGPLLPVDQARTVLEKALKALFGDDAPPVSLPAASDHFFWARPGESLTAVAMYFTRPPLPPIQAKDERRLIIQKLIKWGESGFDPDDPNADLTDLQPATRQAIRDLTKKILRANAGNSLPPLAGGIFENLDDQLKMIEWMRIVIPDDRVDIMEGYMKSILEPLGNTVNFVSEFESLHEAMGELHCGTNAIRTNPEHDPEFKARWWDKGVYDPDFDGSYAVRSSAP
jgi:hypothetical protein